MASVPSNPEIRLDIQVILDSISQLDTASLEGFAEKINQLVAKRKAPALTKEETKLLKEINTGIPQKTLKRFQELQIKKRGGKAQKPEMKELEELTDTIELLEAERLKKMIDLAQVWQITVEELRKRLGIEAPQPHVW